MDKSIWSELKSIDLKQKNTYLDTNKLLDDILKGNFAFDDYIEFIKKEKPLPPQLTFPGEPNKKIKDINEKAYQRSIFNANNSKTEIKRNSGASFVVNWKDYEIPVEFGDSPRRKCLDLIGIINSDQLVIAEIKKTKDAGYPFYGICEAIQYSILALINRKLLADREVYHKKISNNNYWKTISESKPPLILLAGPESYWNFNDKNDTKNKTMKFVNNIAKAKNAPEIILCSFPDEDFEEQRGDENNTYEPELWNNKNNIWKEIK